MVQIFPDSPCKTTNSSFDKSVAFVIRFLAYFSELN